MNHRRPAGCQFRAGVFLYIFLIWFLVLVGFEGRRREKARQKKRKEGLQKDLKGTTPSSLKTNQDPKHSQKTRNIGKKILAPFQAYALANSCSSSRWHIPIFIEHFRDLSRRSFAATLLHFAAGCSMQCLGRTRSECQHIRSTGWSER